MVQNHPLKPSENPDAGASFEDKTHIIKEVRCYEAKIEESEKGRQPPGVEPRTPLA